MKITWAINSGNWSDPQIWMDNLVPEGEVDVYANDNIIRINQDINVNLISNHHTLSSNEEEHHVSDCNIGGHFIAQENTVLVCNICSCCEEVLVYEDSGILTIIGSISGSLGDGYVHGVKNTGSGTINVSGSIYGGSCGFSSGIDNQKSGTINVSNLVYGGTGGYSHGIYNRDTGTINVSGTVCGGGGGYAYGIYNENQGSIFVEGNVYFGNAGYAYGIFNEKNGSITINGLTSNLSGSYGKDAWEMSQ